MANSVLSPLARLGLCRALALTGDADSARQQYAAFFDLWRGADPSVPALQKARVENEALQAR